MGGGCRTPLIKCGPQFYLRTKPAKPLYICSEVRGCSAYWWDETIGRFGANDIASVHYLYDTPQATGAGRRVYWVDGTASQSWNRIMWRYCLDCVNPHSPTFSDGDEALYGRVDLYRNPVGHTFMKPDATHGVVCRRGASLQQVASTKEWSEEVCAKAREGEQAMNSTYMDKSYFRKWKGYLSQMYHANPKTSTGERYRVLSYHWANFGWGRLPNGQRKFHPHEVWLYTCKGNSMEEWYKETHFAVVFAKKCEKGWFQAKQVDANRSVDCSKRHRV